MFSQGFLVDMQIAIALFYLLYRFVLSGRIPSAAARCYLLLSVPAAVVVALVKIPLLPPVTMATVVVSEAVTGGVATEIIESVDPIVYIYSIGVAVMVIWFLIGLFRTLKLVLTTCTENGVRYIHNTTMSAFSFFGAIFINEKYRDSKDQMAQLLAHEGAHARLMHSVDLIYCSVVRAVLWFNPFVWLIVKDLRSVHEWQADHRVIASGAPRAQYIDTLLAAEAGLQPLIASSLNYSLTKKRIKMIAKPSIGLRSALRLLYVVPAMGLMLIALSLTSRAATLVVQAPENTPAVATTPAADTVKTKTEPVIMAEVMPKFKKGDIQTFREWCATKLVYPQQALDEGLQGRVTVSFVITTKGKVEDVKVARSAGKILDDEAVRIIKSSPKWTPAQNNGHPIAFIYNMPLDFILDVD